MEKSNPNKSTHGGHREHAGRHENIDQIDVGMEAQIALISAVDQIEKILTNDVGAEMQYQKRLDVYKNIYLQLDQLHINLSGLVVEILKSSPDQSITSILKMIIAAFERSLVALAANNRRLFRAINLDRQDDQWQRNEKSKIISEDLPRLRKMCECISGIQHDTIPEQEFSLTREIFVPPDAGSDVVPAGRGSKALFHGASPKPRPAPSSLGGA